jgi:hypothetical protein
VRNLLLKVRAPGDDVMHATSNTAGRKRKLTALPLLVVLFAISFTMLIKLVIEQDKTIDAERSLIRLLSDDNAALSDLHKHATLLPKKSSGRANTEIELENPANSSDRASSAPVAPNQDRSNEVQLNQFRSAPGQTSQVPASKAGLPANTKTDRKARKRQVQPPAELSDPSDMRRALFSI